MDYNKQTVYKASGVYKEAGGGGGGGGGETVEIDGKVYPVVTIGTQKWLGKNLEFTFPEATINPGSYLSTPAICYNLLSQYTYGYLYNHYAAKYINDNNLIPGWRVPYIDDYQTLVNYVGGLANVPLILYDKTWKNGSSDLYGFAIKPSGSWAGNVIQSQGININSGSAYFLSLTLSGSYEYHFDCTLTSASITYNAMGAGRSIRLIQDI